jgi:hypothetical protein
VFDAVFLGVAAVTLGAAVYKGRLLRRAGRPPGLVVFCRFLLSLGLAFVFLAPSAQAVESLLVPNLGRLLSNTATLVAAFSVLSMLLHLHHPHEQAAPRIRPRRAALVAAVAVMAALFLSTPTTTAGVRPSGGFGELVASRPTLGVYVLVYSAYLGVALVDLMRLAWRYSGQVAHRRHLRRGLRVVAVGCALGMVYVVEKALSVVLTWAGIVVLPNGEVRCTSPLTPAGCAFSVALPAVAVLVIVAGATLPAWAPVLAAPVRWARDWAAYRELGPLWNAVRAAAPDVVLAVGPPATHWPGGIRFRLYRRVIEIRDGCLATRALREPAVVEDATRRAVHAGRSGYELHAAVEAAVLSDALTRARAGQAPNADFVQVGEVDPDPADLTAEVEWLRRVARAFAHTTRTDTTEIGVVQEGRA